MVFDTVVDKAFLENGLKMIADAIRVGADMHPSEVLPFPDMFVTELERAFRHKDGKLQDAKAETKAFIERTETDIYNEDVVRVSPFSHYHYEKLKTAEYPNAASAGESAFEECTALTSVRLPNAEIIGVKTFKGCTKLSSLVLPKVYEIRDNAFDGCTKLESIDLPSAKTINQYAFIESGLKSISLPAANKIKADAFRKAYSLTSVDLPNVTAIGSNAFDTCVNLQEVSVPMLETLGAYGFAGCTSLKSLDLHKVTSIPNHAFRKATNLGTLYLRNNAVVTLADVGAFYGIRTINVYVPANLIESYKADENWKLLLNDDDRLVSFLPIPAVADGVVYFTINRYGNNENYQAEEGMTWAQWCESEYNTSEPKFYVADWGGIENEWGDCIHHLEGEELGSLVTSDETIQATTYRTYCP